jgi:hypothetical protein
LVRAYNAANTICGNATTAGNTAPNYSISGCGTGPVRVEFTVPTTGSCANSSIDFSALAGATYGSSIQFVNGNSTNVHFALHNPADYNTGSAGVNVYIPCYVSGDPLPAGSETGASPWFVGFPYTNSGGSTLKPSQMVGGEIVGATWGVAYSKQAQKVFTSAFLKRHVGMGVLGTGGIYLLTPTANSFIATSFYDLDANGHRTRASSSAPVYGEGSSYSIASNSIVTYLGSNDALTGKPAGLGVIGTNAERGLTTNPIDPSYDPAAFDQIGKIGLGGLAISDDGKFLFVMNLYTKKVFRLELNDAYNPTSVVSVASYDVPATSCTNGESRPFGLTFHRNKVYVGLVCSGENGGQNIEGGATDVYAYVYELHNPTANATFNTTPLINQALNYEKGGDDWEVWNNNSNVSGGGSQYPTPLVSDIEFSDRGDMIISFLDRSGHQWGFANRKYLKTNTTSIDYQSAGDIVIAGLNCNTGAYSMENNGTITSVNGLTLSGSHTGSVISFAEPDQQGIGGKEFFYDNSNVADPHQETTMGGSSLLKGAGGVIIPAFAVSLEPSDAGMIQLSTTNGDYITGSSYVLYNVFDNEGVSGKANGLGDVDLSVPIAPLEIGNRVWNDTDSDGIQDAGEVGINALTVKLFEGATEVGSTTTANGGQYYFTSANVAGGVKYHTAYQVRIALAQAPLSSLSLTTTDAGGSDLIDNDGTTAGANVVKAFTTGKPGENNHSFDFGFRPPPPCVLPTATLSQTAPTCSGSTSYNNGKIVLTVATNADRYVINAGLTSTGTYATSLPLPLLGATLQSNIPNAGGNYTVRFYNGADVCFTDQTINVAAAPCTCPTATITTNLGGGDACSGNQVTLTATFAGNLTGCTSQWQLFTGGQWAGIAGATGTTFSGPILPGVTQYRIKIVCANGCVTYGQ